MSRGNGARRFNFLDFPHKKLGLLLSLEPWTALIVMEVNFFIVTPVL